MQKRQEFEAEANIIKQTVFERLQVSDAVAKSIQALYHASLSIEVDQFRGFSQEIVRGYPFILAVTYYPHVEYAERQAFEEEQELWGVVGFKIFEFQNNAKVPAASRPSYFPALYREPLKAADAMLLGYDVLSNALLLPAVNQAINSGMAAASGLRTLADQPGYDIFIAMYEGKQVPENVDERKKSVNGLLSLTIVPSALFKASDLHDELEIRLENLSQATTDTQANLTIFEQAAAPTKSLFQTRFSSSFPLHISGQRFELVLSRNIPIYQLHWGMFSLAVLLGILMTIGVTVIQRSSVNLQHELDMRRQTERELDKNVRMRTQELQALQTLLTQISAVEKDLGAAAQNMTNVSSEMAVGAEEMSQQITIVSASSQQINNRAHEASVSMEEIAANIREIASHVEEVAHLILTVVTTSSSAKAAMTELNAHYQEIGDLLSVITEIAQQTNMLSLNASIEANRAGEVGRGFSVVAREVKDLAKETSQLAKNIARKVTVMQSSSSNTTEATDEVIEHVSRVAELSEMIKDAISQQSHVTSESSLSLNEVSDGTKEIATAIQEVTIVAQNSSNLASRVEQDAKQLALFAEQLRKLTTQFEENAMSEQPPASGSIA